ncbi:hypothetical protein [Mycobacterium talmoniae]|uniref:Secreted protein n=1 Tax=Mycobacterium talmoniae TaxID=1858794 RepID=A0A1S1NBI3_9MYCO|nr:MULTISPECIES: hypothetical protein [Mycobacterium]OHV01117.1 hypothetical protein BKN37_17325 [Mycobacterium talmoniae]PQM45448.1 hypothetical protein C1Y40_04388 [Mycobacterium talmoniae]TDH50217.1 hypothetical protein E2F47_18740 [Mycobacterium eburneum]
MTLTKNSATLTASVAAGLFLAMAVSNPTAAADPTPPPGPDTSNDTTTAEATAALEESVAEQEIQFEKLNAAQILENSASALNSFPSLFPETPVALLETTATVLSAVGLAG